MVSGRAQTWTNRRRIGIALIRRSVTRTFSPGGSEPAEQDQDQNDDENEAKSAAAIVTGPVKGTPAETAKATE